MCHVVTRHCNIRIAADCSIRFWIQARPERELITVCEMGNVKVSTLQLSSLLGRSRFRSGRFGGGRAAGELVLDCQSCPVYHLDGLIVLQSQLSSLENCVDLHSKKPQMQLYLWSIENQTSGGNGPACISHYCSPPSSYMCANGHHSPVCTNVTRRVSTSRDFWKRINHSP